MMTSSLKATRSITTTTAPNTTTLRDTPTVAVEATAPAFGLLSALGLLLIALQLGFGLLGAYGLFIDELYFLACADRLAWGYVDHPPLAPAILWLSQQLLGSGDLALRLPAALAGAATLVLTGLLAWRLGGGRWAQGLAALAVLIAPLAMLLFGFFSMNAFEVLLWTAGAYTLVRLEQRGDPRLWWIFGLLAGLGLLNKHTMVLFALGLGVGVVTTRARRHLAGRHLWQGLGVAILVLAPNLVWQALHGWPSLDFYAGATAKNVPTPPFEVLAMQVLTMNPVNLLLWGPGLIALLVAERFRPYRHLGWLAVTLLVLAAVAQQSRPDRIAGIYPMLFAAGAVVVCEVWARRRRWLPGALAGWMVLNGLVLAPIGLPVLGPETMARYVAAIGVVPQIEAGAGKTSELPQWYADRFGWRQLAEEVDALVAELPAHEQDDVVIFAPSYGQAGALERYATSGAPVYSTHNNYFLWGPPETVTVALVLGDSAEHLETLFAEVAQVQVHDCTWCLRWRDDMPIYRVRYPRRPIAEVWPELRNFG